MLRKKPSSSEKKRKHSHSRDRQEESKRRSTESYKEDFKDELTDPELDKISSDIEAGGLDLSVPFQPIKAYIGDKKEMLEQCFHVLGDKKLHKMLPDELKECSLDEIKTLCWEQLEPISEKSLLQILEGEELATMNSCEGTLDSQQDNIVDSTSCLKETAKADYPKHEAGGYGEESDVLSINADAYDSDIEGPKEEQTTRGAAVLEKEKVNDHSEERHSEPTAHPEPKPNILNDIEKSVCEILAPCSESSKDEPTVPSGMLLPTRADSPAPVSPHSGEVCKPSVQQLELLELEMRARAIKALMKAGDKKKLCLTTNL